MTIKQSTLLQKTLISVAGVIVLLFILILCNVILSYANIRLDITQDNMYSLSKGTRQILVDMSQPVTVKFFYSRSQNNLPPDLKLYAQQVRDFLSEYERVSRGKIKVEFYDPKPDSDEEEWADRYGIRPMQTPLGEKIYAGLVFLSLDQEEKIEILDPAREKLLEYDITRLIYRLQTAKKKRVGIITALPVFGDFTNPMMPSAPEGQEPWYCISELKKSFTLRPIEPTEEKLEPGLDLLLIIHPKDLNPRLQYAIDQYVLKGGKVMAFIDPFCVLETRQSRQAMMTPSRSSLDRLLKAWGLNMDMSKITADMDQFTHMRGANGMPEDNPILLSVRGQSFNKNDIVTSQLESMLFPVAGAIKKMEGHDYTIEPLIQTSENAGQMPSYVASFGTTLVRREFSPEGKRLNLAVRVRGKFKSAFPDGPPPIENKNPSQPPTQPIQPLPDAPHLAEAKEPATVIVVADADFLADPFYVQKNRFLGYAIARVFNDNLNFTANVCETLSGSDALVNLRSRGSFERPFTTVRDLERRAQKQWLFKEKELMEKAERANMKLRELEQQKDASQKTLLSPEQEAEIQRFKEDRRRINQELKQVRKSLRADIETLGLKLKVINLFLMPLLVAVAGMVFGVYRQKRIKRK